MATVNIPVKTELEIKQDELKGQIAEFNSNNKNNEIKINTSTLTREQAEDVEKLLNEQGASAEETAEKINQIGKQADDAAEKSKDLGERLTEVENKLDNLVKDGPYPITIDADTNPVIEKVDTVVSEIQEQKPVLTVDV